MNQTERRTLSSDATWSYKFFWPAFTAIAFIAFSILVWSVPVKAGNGVVWLARFALPAIGTGCTAWGIAYGRKLSRVQMDDEGLYISNFRQEIRLPFSQVENCRVSWDGEKASVPVVTIELRQPIAFGRQIVFIAAQPWNISHSIVAEIRERRDHARGEASPAKTP